jgi:protein TonB
MKQGKQTCKILKEIRKQIADANDIEFITSECKYKGECLGTCPKCEAEVRYLEEQLNYRRKTGKAVALLGLSAGLFTLSSAAELPATKIPDNSTHIEQTDSIIVKGVVKDHNKKLVEGAVVEDTQTHTQVLTDANGMFAIKIPQKHWLLITHPQAGNASISPAQITRKRQEVTLSNEKVFGTSEESPLFPGGTTALFNWIATHLKYPEAAKRDSVQGRVILNYTVTKRGTIKDIQIARSLRADCDAEAVRLMKEMPRWKPGKQNGVCVDVKYTLPITFKLKK